MSWEVRTYQSERPGMAAADVLDEKVERGVLKVACPSCGVDKNPFQIADLRGWPPAFRAAVGGASFACDGCIARFERDGLMLPDGRRFREEILYELQGAPSDFVDEARDALDLRDARRAEKAKPGVFREDDFRAAHSALIDRIDAREVARRQAAGR